MRLTSSDYLGRHEILLHWTSDYKGPGLAWLSRTTDNELALSPVGMCVRLVVAALLVFGLWWYEIPEWGLITASSLGGLYAVLASLEYGYYDYKRSFNYCDMSTVCCKRCPRCQMPLTYWVVWGTSFCTSKCWLCRYGRSYPIAFTVHSSERRTAFGWSKGQTELRNRK